MSEHQSFKEELLKFYEDCYKTEIERKDKLLERVNLAAGFLTILGGILAYYITSWEFVALRWYHLFFYLPFIAGCVTTVTSMVYVSLSIAKGFTYKYIPETTEIARFVNDAQQFNSQAAHESQIDVRSAFYENLSGQYCEYAAINSRHNIARSGYIFAALKWAVRSMFIVPLAAPGFFFLKSDFPDKPTQVKMCQPVQVITMSESEKPQQPPPQPATPPQPVKPVAQVKTDSGQAPVVTKPIWPQGRSITEAAEKSVDSTNLIRGVSKESPPPKKSDAK